MPSGPARIVTASLLTTLLATAGTAVAQPAPAEPAQEPIVVETPSTTVIINPGPPVAPQPPSAAPPPAAPAVAQPPAVQPAPQTHAWGEVSHINGQLVPVGQSNDYLYKFRRTNISTNPIGWMLGFYGLSVSYGLNDHFAIRGDINYMNPLDSSIFGVEVGVGVPIYFRRTYQGAFLEPGFIVRNIHDSYDYDGCDSCNDTSTSAGPQMLFGWHWTWDSGFNVAVAAGFGRNWSTRDSENDYDDEEIFPNGYFRIGYAF